MIKGYDAFGFMITNSKLIFSIFVIILAFIVTFLIKKFLNKAFEKISARQIDENKQLLLKSYINIINNIIRFIIYVIAVIIILIIYDIQITIMIASAGFIGVMITYVFQDTIKDVTNGFFILFQAPIKIGDTVKIGEYIGVVTEIEARYVVLIEKSGNKDIINNRVIDSISVIEPAKPRYRRRKEK